MARILLKRHARRSTIPKGSLSKLKNTSYCIQLHGIEGVIASKRGRYVNNNVVRPTTAKRRGGTCPQKRPKFQILVRTKQSPRRLRSSIHSRRVLPQTSALIILWEIAKRFSYTARYYRPRANKYARRCIATNRHSQSTSVPLNVSVPRLST